MADESALPGPSQEGHIRQCEGCRQNKTCSYIRLPGIGGGEGFEGDVPLEHNGRWYCDPCFEESLDVLDQDDESDDDAQESGFSGRGKDKVSGDVAKNSGADAHAEPGSAQKKSRRRSRWRRSKAAWCSPCGALKKGCRVWSYKGNDGIVTKGWLCVTCRERVESAKVE